MEKLILGKTRPVSKSLSTVAWTGALAYLALTLYAAAHWHGLYSDGAYVLMRTIQNEGIVEIHPSRWVSQLLLQLPTVLALRAGLADTLPQLSFVFGFSLLIWPLALTALAAMLIPSEHAPFRIFPWLAFFAGTLMTSFAAIAEASISAAFFWVLLTTLLFHACSTTGLILLFALTACATLLHETYFFLSPILATASFLRARKTQHSAHRWAFLGLTAAFLAIAVLQLHFVLHPISSQAREGFISALVRMHWLFEDRALNMPVVLGSTTVGLCFLRGVTAAHPALRGFAPHPTQQATLLGLLAAVCIAFPLLGPEYFSPASQFAARNHPAFLSAALALAMLACWKFAKLEVAVRACATPKTLALLIVGNLGWHAVVQTHWADYVASYRALLEGHNGLLSWPQAIKRAPPTERQALWAFTWGWPNPAMSILLAPDGEVGTIIDDWSTPPKREIFNPEMPETLPRSRFWDLTPYTEMFMQMRNVRTTNP